MRIVLRYFLDLFTLPSFRPPLLENLANAYFFPSDEWIVVDISIRYPITQLLLSSTSRCVFIIDSF
jgi:hypothetical protein